MRFASLIFISVWLTSLFTVQAQDAAPTARYSIKQAAPTTGTSIPRDVISGSLIPVNRRYAELTLEQQGILKSRYEAIAENDEPPFPIDGLEPVYSTINKGQAKILARGVLEMHVDIDANGDAKSVKVLQSPNDDLTKFVASVFLLTKFKPAVCAGAPCAMSYPFAMTFSVSQSGIKSRRY